MIPPSTLMSIEEQSHTELKRDEQIKYRVSVVDTAEADRTKHGRHSSAVFIVPFGE